jgi:hypothetical protein
MLNNKTTVGGVFHVKCLDSEGNVKWDEAFHNLVVNEGLQDINAKYFTGVTYTATWYMGLVNTGATYAAGDTMASHSTWTENVGYVQSARPTMAFGSPTLADPSVLTSTPTVFTISATSTIAGAFLSTANAKSGTTGLLFSVGNFTVGDRPVFSGDTLNVTYVFSADAA